MKTHNDQWGRKGRQKDKNKHTLGIKKRTKQSHHWREAYEKGPAQRNLDLEQGNDYEEAAAKKDRAKRRKRAERRHLRHGLQCEECAATRRQRAMVSLQTEPELFIKSTPVNSVIKDV